jgi:hypothetical protein
VSVEPTVSPIAYQLSHKQIDTTVGIFVSADSRELRQVIKPRSYECSGWSYPVDIGNCIRTCVVDTAGACFTKFEKIEHLPKAGGRFDGILAAEVIYSNIELTFQSGFWPSTADASAEMNIKLTFYDSNLNPVWRSVVGYANRQTAEGGGSCQGGAEAIGNAIEACLKNITIQMAEKITHSNEIAEAIHRQKVGEEKAS